MDRRLPRWAMVLFWLVYIGPIHWLLPVSLARRGRRIGWRNGRPGPANLLGVAPLAAGTVLVVWVAAGHYRGAVDKSYELKLSIEPEYLLTDGPYRFSRNPMHLGGLGIWAGWALLLGSARVAGGLGILAAVFTKGVVVEERALERRFGDEWRTYAARTPRWLGIP